MLSHANSSARRHISDQPGKSLDPGRRYQIYGPIRPMDEPRGLLQRLFGIG